MSGDKIVHRALAPLPELSSIVFLRAANRDFVTGRGPLPPRASMRVRTFMRWGAWIFLIAAVLTCLAAGIMEIFRREGEMDDLHAVFIISGPLLLGVAGVYWLFAWTQTRRAAKEQVLNSQGGLIGGELTGVKYNSGSNDGGMPTLRVDYRFTAPDGQAVQKRQHLQQFDHGRKNLPPVGSKVLVLYVDAETFEVL